MESYLALHPGTVPWVASGRGASRHSFDLDIEHVIDIPCLGRERADTAHC